MSNCPLPDIARLLTGKSCPKCGSEDLRVLRYIMAEVDRKGQMELTDEDWLGEAAGRCATCGQDGTVADLAEAEEPATTNE
jgi:hypothetical protein